MLIEENYTPQKRKDTVAFQVIVLVLLVIIAVSVVQVGRTIVGIEALKVGWEENREKLKTLMKSDAYKDQYTQSIELMLQEINDEAWTQEWQNPNEDISWTSDVWDNTNTNENDFDTATGNTVNDENNSITITPTNDSWETIQTNTTWINQ